MQLTKNFHLDEFLNGTALPGEAQAMNQEPTMEQLLSIGQISFAMQVVRNEVQKQFGSRFKGFVVTAGLRDLEWELKQGRSGRSQHVKGWAVDVQPICSYDDYLEIFYWIFNKYKDNWKGGLAQKKPILSKGKKGFIHFDLRHSIARWEY